MFTGAPSLSSSPLLLHHFGHFPSTKPPFFSSLLYHRISLPHPISRSIVAGSKSASNEGFWEDPGDGIDEEYNVSDEEEDLDGDLGVKKVRSVAVGADDKSAKAQYDEIFREVELLLEPEERAILRQNEVADLSKISTNKWNPLHSLALSVQISSMDKLLEQGLDIDSVDKDGFTVLHKAVIGKKEAVISHLLRKGANPHISDRDGATALHHAVQVGAIQTVKLLIKFKADVNAADNDGWTPLHLAVQCRSRDIAKVLLINGSDKTRSNKDGKTALDMCLCFGKDFKSYDLAKLLKQVPANRDL